MVNIIITPEAMINRLIKVGIREKLKKNIIQPPKIIKLIPPINSHFHEIKTNTINTIQGKALGLFFIIPSIPPPYLSVPDKIAKRVIKIPKINKMYLNTFLTLSISLFIYPKNPLVNVESFA